MFLPFCHLVRIFLHASLSSSFSNTPSLLTSFSSPSGMFPFLSELSARLAACLVTPTRPARSGIPMLDSVTVTQQVQLTLEQYGFGLCGSIYTWIFFFSINLKYFKILPMGKFLIRNMRGEDEEIHIYFAYKQE